MSNPQIVSDKKTIEADFSHRFAEGEETGQPDPIHTIIWMAERALGVLHLLERFLEQEDVPVHAQTSIYAITAEVEDIKAVAHAVIKEKFD